MDKTMTKFAPACLLFFLAPFVGELLSGSAPPVEFFNPLSLLILCVLYGGGAIIIRELKIRWHKGWLSLLLLGAAYAIIEEGLMVKSFFDPEWIDLGILGTYGRWLGINWVWCIELTIYHTVVSIAIPITLTELIFYKQNKERWTNDGAFIILMILFWLDVVVGYFFLTPYRPSLATYLPTVALTISLIILAYRLPKNLFPTQEPTARSPFWYWIISFLGTIAFFIVFWALPLTNLTPLFTILISILLILVITWSVRMISGRGFTLNDKQKLALAVGPLTVFVLLSPIHEFDISRIDDTRGMIVVGLVTLIFLIWMWWWVSYRSRNKQDIIQATKN